MTRAHVIAALFGLAIAVSSCSSGAAPNALAAAPTVGAPSTGGTPTPVARQAPPITGPILALVPASSVDDKGQPVNPHFTFKPDEPQITLLVQVGQVHGSPLTITWYQETDNGETKLFDHTVDVTSYDRAFSTGKNPGTLAEGEYRVTASLEGQTQEARVAVAATAPPSAAAAPPPSSSGPTLAVQSSASTAQGQPPVSGQSGTVPRPSGSPSGGATGQNPWGGPPAGSATSGCAGALSVDVPGTGGSQLTSLLAQTVNLFWQTQGCAGSAAVGLEATAGKAIWLADWTALTPGQVSVFRSARLDPCDESIANDNPGSHFSVAIHKYAAMFGSPHLPDWFSSSPEVTQATVTLAEDKTPPNLKVTSDPKGGSTVKAGDQIQIHATAEESKVTWQTGVKLIQVTVDPPDGVDRSWTNPSNLPQPCAAKTWSHTLDATYTVPANPPADIRICVLAEDYAGNQGHSCATFHTGNIWKGKFHSVSSSVDPVFSCPNETWDGDFQVEVSGSGDVKGKGTAHLVAPPNCVPPVIHSQAGNVTQDIFACTQGATQEAFDVKGTFDGKQFRFSFSQTSVNPKHGTCGGSDLTLFIDPKGMQAGGYNRSPSDFAIPLIAPGDAEGQVSSSVPLQPTGQLKGQHTFTLLCQDCK